MFEIKMRFPEGRRKALTLSYDDGVEQDIRLIDIMKNNGLKGTFNLNSGQYRDADTVYKPGTIHRRMSMEEATKLYADSGMEVALHGLTHPFLERIPRSLCLEEIIRDRDNLEKQFGVLVRGAAYPYGTYNEYVIEVLRMAGIVYARTTVSTENFDIPQDWLRQPATCHHNNPRLRELAEDFVEDRRDRHGSPQLFYVWGHSYEFEQNDNWEVIERFASYIGGRREIWYATNIEVCDYVENYRRLIFSMDGTRVFNPTCQDIYIEAGGAPHCIASGETVEL